MRARLVILGAATWLIVSACAGARTCDAGFLGAADGVQWSSESSGAGAAANQVRGIDPAQDAPAPEFLPGVNAVIGEGSASSVPASDFVRITNAATVAALGETCRSVAISATEQLQIRESALIPAVYLSRVFRPPRCER